MPLVSRNTCKGPAKRIQHHPTLLNPTLLDDVAHCCTRWPNECNMLDSTLGLERSGSEVFYSRCLLILVPRGRAPFGQHQESRPLARWLCKHKRLRPNTRRNVSKFPSIIHVTDRSDRNPPITARKHDVRKV